MRQAPGTFCDSFKQSDPTLKHYCSHHNREKWQKLITVLVINLWESYNSQKSYKWARHWKVDWINDQNIVTCSKIMCIVFMQVLLKHSYMEISSCGRSVSIPNYFAYIAGWVHNTNTLIEKIMFWNLCKHNFVNNILCVTMHASLI